MRNTRAFGNTTADNDHQLQDCYLQGEETQSHFEKDSFAFFSQQKKKIS